MASIFPANSMQLAGQSYVCPCGRTHTVKTQKIVVEHGALSHLLDTCGLTGEGFVIADTNTWPLVSSVLGKLPHYVFDGTDLHADEAALGNVLIEYPPETKFLIAVGGGTMGDIARYVCYRVGLPFVYVVTAPSMDGIASSVAPLIHKSRKETYPAVPAYAIYCDLDIMANAPMPMLAAGYGDVAGKYIAALDWEISHLVTGEHLCEQIRDLTMDAVKRCEQAAPGLPLRDDASIASLAEGLILSGLAIQLYVDSRPASGMEHMYSHLWETQAVQRGKPVALHGDKVGIGTLMAMDVYHEFFRVKRQPRRPLEGLDYDKLLAHWDELKARVDELYANRARIVACIQSAGGPIHPRQLNIADKDVVYAFYHNFEGRARFTLSHLIAQMGLLDEILQEVIPQWIG